MANPKKTWFLAPTWDIPPESLSLGHLLTDPTDPRFSINPDFSSAHLSDLFPNPPKIYKDTTPAFHMTVSSDTTTTLGIWGQFLQVVGIGAEACISFTNGMSNSYGFDKTETQWFAPSPVFVKRMLADPEVMEFIDMAGTKKPLYMVTGLKAVTGAELSTTNSSGHAISAKFGIDGTPFMAPVSIGPEVELARNDGLVVHVRKENPIIFAYQLMKVKLKAKRGDIMVGESKAFVKGAMFEAGAKGKSKNKKTFAAVETGIEGGDEGIVAIVPQVKT
ncbi:hypothetical protein P154DRAFT_65760 [Amniculicola lignicola CBS 123094]|uniref:Uncharacterized protein n=1 Tax=Amniculicola lignicola CBS 123094 TaxID=1392246 RepID=A0A6A5WSW9_9PLEO|nr:hypothetical protein P154DRAFT_65760 [Amniculicola lignicola CBS 123094]